ncbi:MULTISPECIES: molybdenum cofactor biosynthesis protein B [unclassified Pseudoalteromonas]|uniref:molybdenum cofactor biosynthesis protein B n=1 Tax=unclassified Pseudoalteromonas TaxID=194690 RepID=UPI000CF65653|nr:MULTISPECIES: molybdenum cofactor biosynthesis protein B [unclassified Pseudoalteromonas]MBS3798029.1 molybdenum cofactor biosynthesis protein B [Pseudoalteromonas sp. BDTF-M6]
MSHLAEKVFQALNIAVLTVSDTRDEATDTSGQALVDGLLESGHHLADKAIVKDDIYQIRACVSQWIASDDVQAILVTGGTGFTARDNTPEALTPLFDKQVPGFGEVFRSISEKHIGTSTIQSRAVAGMANGVVMFAMPGSTNACKTAWYEVIKEQLDARHGPCNFVPHLKKSAVLQCVSRG